MYSAFQYIVENVDFRLYNYFYYRPLNDGRAEVRRKTDNTADTYVTIHCVSCSSKYILEHYAKASSEEWKRCVRLNQKWKEEDFPL